MTPAISQTSLNPSSLSVAALAQKTIELGAMQKTQELTGLIEFLQQYGRDNLNSCLEIGSHKGGTFWLLSQLASSSANLFSIDIPNGHFGGAVSEDDFIRMQSYHQEQQKAHFIRSDSHLASTKENLQSHLSGKLDLLFIDGDHSLHGVAQDFVMYAPLVKPGGLIIFHDILEHNQVSSCKVASFWNQLKALGSELGKATELVDPNDQNGFGVWGGIGIIQLNNPQTLASLTSSLTKELPTKKRHEVLSSAKIAKDLRELVVEKGLTLPEGYKFKSGRHNFCVNARLSSGVNVVVKLGAPKQLKDSYEGSQKACIHMIRTIIHAPAVIETGTWKKYAYCIELELKGTELAQIKEPEAWHRAGTGLRELHRTTEPEYHQEPNAFKLRSGFRTLINTIQLLNAQKDSLTLKEKFSIGATMFEALRQNRSRCLIHGAATPENILIDQERVGLIDNGSACYSDFAGRDLSKFFKSSMSPTLVAALVEGYFGKKLQDLNNKEALLLTGAAIIGFVNDFARHNNDPQKQALASQALSRIAKTGRFDFSQIAGS